MKILITIFIVLSFTACGTNENAKIKSDPEAIRYNNLAVDHQMNGNIDSALYFIEKAIQIDSSKFLFHVQRLQFLWGLNRNEEALLEAKKISKLKDYKNVSLEGMAYERLGNLNMARELYKQTVDNWPTKELDDHQSRIEYAQLVTIVYGKEKGLQELNKIDESKLPPEQYEVVEYIRQSIKTFNGTGYFDFKFSNEVQTK